MDMPGVTAREIGEGNITIKLGDDEHVLKPSINAMQSLSRKYGGLNALVDRLGRIDFDAVVDVIELGLGVKNTPRARTELAEKIYMTGLTDDTGRLCERCIDYVGTLMRGGRKPKPIEEQDVGNATQPN